jgi:YHS domain-containing protein
MEQHDVPQHRVPGVFAILYRLYRSQRTLRGGAGYAVDPVCGMQAETARAPTSADPGGERYHFCSEGCRDHFLGPQGGPAPHPSP